MLTLVEKRAEKSRIQHMLKRILLKALPAKGKYDLGFQGNHVEVAIHFKDAEEIYYAHGQTREVDIPRYLNTFGIFEPNRSMQNMVLEINIPMDSNSERVAAYFAENKATGQIFLMHSGRIGGGRKGIGKVAYLAWSDDEIVPVAEESGKLRGGIIVSEIDEQKLFRNVSEFVKKVADFKDQAAEGKLQTKSFERKVKDVEDRYRREFSGKKRSKARGAIEYDTYHGDIVDALFETLNAGKQPGDKVVNTTFIDLTVKRDGKPIEIYEVKTGTARQVLYTAIGQLTVHSGGDADLRKIMVLPKGEKLPNDIGKAINSAGIKVWRFKEAKNGWQIEML